MATAQPIKSSTDVQLVRDTLTTNRDRALFELGINLAFRGGDLLTLNVGDVRGKEAGDELVIEHEQKTGKARRTNLNQKCVDALAPLIAERVEQGATDADPLFVSAKPRNGSHSRLTIVSLSRLWKDWGMEAGLKNGARLSSHSGRKTKAYILRTEGKVGIEVLMKVLNHSSPAVTMRYACIQDDECRDFFMQAI